MSVRTRLACQSRRFVSKGYTRSARQFSAHGQRCSQSDSASSIAASFLSRFNSLGPQTRTQVLDSNQLLLLSLTLNRPTLHPNSPVLTTASGSLQQGTPLPAGYHLVYFTPTFLETELGADGTDVSYNPDTPFTRRMWAGGEVQWPRGPDGMPNPLRVGQEIQETTRVLSAEPKIVRRTGEEMIVVGVEKEFRNEHGVAGGMTNGTRNWVFRKALSPSSAAASTNLPDPITPSGPAFSKTSTIGNVHTRTMKQTAVTLFRFSALTFNPHKIHYSLPWARDVEGHRDIVVHGPLNLINILDLWRDTRTATLASEAPELILPQSISYRATSPLYAEEEYRIILEDEDSIAKVQVIGPDGKTVAMKADIKS